MTTVGAISFRFWLGLAKHAIYVADGVAARRAASQAAPADLRDAALRDWEDVSIGAKRWTLAGRFASGGPRPRAAVLLLHGIGERRVFWQGVQVYLAQHRVASLVFSYPGYEDSSGATTPDNLRDSAANAYAWLLARVRLMRPGGLPVFLLGFSLGTGLAAEVAGQLDPAPAGMILCQPYTTLRAAARRVVHPVAILARLLPDHWRTVDAVRSNSLPLLLVHGDRDRLFPVQMSKEIFAAAREGPGRSVELAIPAGLDHNAAYAQVPERYWRPILDFLQRCNAV
jgi:alpha-beta hydrolase superfamily lysophospholipase